VRIGLISHLRDVSERRAADLALAESELRYRAIAENATDIISRARVTGEFIYLSPSIAEVTGRSVEELTGQNMLDYVHPDDLASTLAAYGAIVRGEREDGEAIIYRAQHKDGRWMSLESNPTPVHDENGRVTEFIDVTRNVSARVQLESELRAARDAAEAATATKADFMANMSHEIRTPLTAILGFTGLLTTGSDLGAEAKNHVQRIAGAGQALLSIVNDILDFSKLEAGQVEIKPGPGSPGAVLDEALMLFSPQADAKGLKLSLVGAESLPPCVSLDRDRLRQVLLNLIGNAVKFTEAGEVRLAATYDQETGRLNVRVQDTGAGMNKAQQQRLFQRFSQVDASSTRRHGGTGLGLAICKGLLEAMGGEIGVRSRPGHGSVFHFSIDAPRATAAEDAAGCPSYVGFAGARILVADDNPVNRELVRAILAPLGVDLTEAVDGPSALEAALSLPFDLILMDVRMPGLDGPEVVSRLRRQTGPNMDVPMLAFTADADLRRFEGAADFDGAVSKPISPTVLVESLAHHLDWLAQEPQIEETPYAVAS
jgi:PAS domain S-box-containing protein